MIRLRTALLATLGALLLAAAPAQATFPGTNGVLVLQPTRGSGLLLTDVHGRHVQPICTDPVLCGRARAPRFAPDGRDIGNKPLAPLVDVRGGGAGNGGCTATLSAGSSGNGWYNLNVAVTGSNTWTVTVNMVAPSVVHSTWNVSASWPSQYVMTAKPNGSGNNWGFTVTTNGTSAWPSVSCTTG